MCYKEFGKEQSQWDDIIKKKGEKEDTYFEKV